MKKYLPTVIASSLNVRKLLMINAEVLVVRTGGKKALQNA